MSRISQKLKSLSLKQTVLLVFGWIISLLLVASVLTSRWVLVAVLATTFLLYISVLVVLVLRQLEYRLSADHLSGLLLAPGGGVVRAQSLTSDRKSRKKSDVVLRQTWGSVGFYAELNARKSKYLGKQIVRSRYVDGRDVLAHVITKGRMDMLQFRDLLDAYRAPVKRKAVVAEAFKFNGDALREMARVLYRQDLSVGDRLDAIACYELLYDVHGARSLSQHDVDWFLASLLGIDDEDGFRRWVDRLGLAAQGSINYPFLLANANNPWRKGSLEHLGRWNEIVSGVYEGSGVPAPRVRCLDGVAFQQIDVDPASEAEGPLISVIMPMYNPGPEALWSVRSIINQSWKNLELIVVDDGSTEGRDVIREIESIDERARVVALSNNQGAYSARNEGLKVARGELVTCHDADDWAHPLRLELQAKDLLSEADTVANISSLCRVDRNLEFKNRNSIANPNFVYPAFVTLMFKRAPVLEKVGFWDRVRKAGDSELISRIKLVFDQDIPVVRPRLPLTFAMLDENSLSGRELFRGYLHPERGIYQRRYSEWHADIRNGTASGYMPAQGERIFQAPPSFLPVVEATRFDVVFVSELGFTGGNANSLLHEITICLDAGLRVGIVRARNLLFVGATAEREPIEPIRALIRSGRVAEVALTTRCDASLVMVRWPACFQYLPQLEFGIRARNTIVIANHVPYETGNVRHFYDIQKVLDNAKRAFGPDPLWAPMSAVIRALCKPHLAPSQLLDIDWVAVLEGSASALRPRTEPVSSVPVLGRHSRDDHLKWPETRKALLDAYPVDGELSVRVMGGITKLLVAGLITADEASTWVVYEFNELPPADFLKTIDFFVYFPHRELVEAFGRVIMEALASGAVVVVPRHFEPIYGDACVYADPPEVRSLVAALYGDWDAYLAQSRRGQDFIRLNCTPDAYVRRLRALGVAV